VWSLIRCWGGIEHGGLGFVGLEEVHGERGVGYCVGGWRGRRGNNKLVMGVISRLNCLLEHDTGGVT
jgi:hypothetical protein